MKGYIKNMIGESLKEEVDINNEWSRLASSINRLSGGSKKKVFLRLVSYAAAMFIGVVLSISAFYFVEKKPLAMVGTYKLVTDKGEKSYLQLPDGTNVWLNSCTTIEYAPDYGKSNRDIHLDGEAYFEVAKNKELPFIVKTSGGIDVKAVGTAFNVLAYSDDAKLITTLFSGKVVVQPTLTKQQILLEPNQVAVYYKGRNKIEIVPYDKKMFAQWRGGALSFEMMYLEDITKLLERNYNVVFRYQNQKIKKLKFSGSFRNSEDLSEILRVIKTNTSITYQVVKDTIIIK
ncbi:FecR family protein [Parabacteroides chinchillae]|uniref:FecR family protein n=1 Tax=Parabacteroides chinchillae TaxID=871327 RepID=A0A8G2BV99_9BACT|nr:FecR domain-containing protein [Parabacteroides chinchillae]SEF70507.1 FecR family protein [Parabacteroides chinchillae]